MYMMLANTHTKTGFKCEEKGDLKSETALVNRTGYGSPCTNARVSRMSRELSAICTYRAASMHKVTRDVAGSRSHTLHTLADIQAHSLSCTIICQHGDTRDNQVRDSSS